MDDPSVFAYFNETQGGQHTLWVEMDEFRQLTVGLVKGLHPKV